MHKILKMVIENFSGDYWQYRFDKASNFLTQDQWRQEKAEDMIIRLGEELKRKKHFRNVSDEELLKKYAQVGDYLHDAVQKIPVEHRNDIYRKNEGWDAHAELKRRGKEDLIHQFDRERYNATV